MATGSSRKSSIWRLGASASSRLTEGLLSSNGKVAGVGLATACATLVFAIWFGLELRYESRVGTPLTRTAAVMNTSVNQSLAALRGWVAYGDPSALDEREHIWGDLIEPALDDLTTLAQATGEKATIEHVAQLRKSLRELELSQWAIEDVARIPGNEPARVVYERRLAPVRRNVLRGLRAAIEQYGARAGDERAVALLTELARFRASFSEADLALNALVDEFSEAQRHSVERRLSEAGALAAGLEELLRDEHDDDLRMLVEFTVGEFSAYEIQVPEVVALRRSAEANVARLLFVNEAQPLVLRARSLSSELAEAQASRTVGNAELMTRASYAVIAMATLMGLLSGGSLFVSFRLNRQVHNVMARAKRLGQYEMDKRLGKGGMGEVYLAHHAMLRRATAIKLLRADNAQDLRAQQRFQREVQLTCQLTHPNTIEIFDYGRTPAGIFYYAMELLDGFTLEALVSLGGPVDPRRVVHILVQACGSLQEAHDKELLHRDIKPNNIMLTTRGGICDTVKILDFGLVKELTGDDTEESDVIVGTPMYLAPELILSADSASPQSDLYALGAVGYFLLSGSTVFPTGSILEILTHQLEDECDFPSERIGKQLPESLEYVIMSCLAKDPSDRPASAAQLAQLLNACDCGTWSSEDARLWWEEFGEAARSQHVVEDASGSALRSGLEVVVEASRA